MRIPNTHLNNTLLNKQTQGCTPGEVHKIIFSFEGDGLVEGYKPYQMRGYGSEYWDKRQDV